MDSRDPNDVIGEPQVAASAADKPHNRTERASPPLPINRKARDNGSHGNSAVLRAHRG